MSLHVILTSMSLILTSVACLAGLYAKVYKDNFFQTVGMALTGLGALGWAYLILTGQQEPPVTAALPVGMLLFSTGTVLKVWMHNRKAPPQPKEPRCSRLRS